MKAFLVHADPSHHVAEGTERDLTRSLLTGQGAGAEAQSGAGAGAQRATDAIICQICSNSMGVLFLH